MSAFTCRKTYGPELGLSCCFRQHRAKSHCSRLHGYPLSFSFEFGCEKLDENGWVLDFGGLKPLRDALVAAFDHTTAVAEDDPVLPAMEKLADDRVIDLRVVRRTGCEGFAYSAWHVAQALVTEATKGRAWVKSVTCAEHGANSATYAPEPVTNA